MCNDRDRPKFAHVIAVMFARRSFDNLLGRLYEPGEVGRYEGVLGKEPTNPMRELDEHGSDHSVVPANDLGELLTRTTPRPAPERNALIRDAAARAAARAEVHPLTKTRSPGRP